MNNSFNRLIDGMTATLRQEVLTRLDDEFARGQVFGVINLLNTMRLRADWSITFLHQELSAQREAFARFDAVLAGDAAMPADQATAADAASPADPKSPPSHPVGDAPALIDANALIAMRDEGNRAIIDLLRWLWSRPAGVPQQRLADLEAVLRRSMRTEVEVELRHSSKPMFAEMSQGTEEKAP